MTVGWPPSMTATTELVVPRSIPMTFPGMSCISALLASQLMQREVHMEQDKTCSLWARRFDRRAGLDAELVAACGGCRALKLEEGIEISRSRSGISSCAMAERPRSRDADLE